MFILCILSSRYLRKYINRKQNKSQYYHTRTHPIIPKKLTPFSRLQSPKSHKMSHFEGISTVFVHRHFK